MRRVGIALVLLGALVVAAALAWRVRDPRVWWQMHRLHGHDHAQYADAVAKLIALQDPYANSESAIERFAFSDEMAEAGRDLTAARTAAVEGIWSDDLMYYGGEAMPASDARLARYLRGTTGLRPNGHTMVWNVANAPLPRYVNYRPSRDFVAALEALARDERDPESARDARDFLEAHVMQSAPAPSSEDPGAPQPETRSATSRGGS